MRTRDVGQMYDIATRSNGMDEAILPHPSLIIDHLSSLAKQALHTTVYYLIASNQP